MPIYKILIL